MKAVKADASPASTSDAIRAFYAKLAEPSTMDPIEYIYRRLNAQQIGIAIKTSKKS